MKVSGPMPVLTGHRLSNAHGESQGKRQKNRPRRRPLCINIRRWIRLGKRFPRLSQTHIDEAKDNFSIPQLYITNLVMIRQESPSLEEQ